MILALGARCPGFRALYFCAYFLSFSSDRTNGPDFKFYLDMLKVIKHFPIWCNVNFMSVFTALNNAKKKQKNKANLTLHNMGNIFIS